MIKHKSCADGLAISESFLSIQKLCNLTRALTSAQIFAVDSPDGQVDGHLLEEMQTIGSFIDDAAVLEDKAKILYQQKLEELVKKERMDHDG